MRYKIVWSDGYVGVLIKELDGFRLEAKRLKFKTIKELEAYYKGTIKSMVKE